MSGHEVVVSHVIIAGVAALTLLIEQPAVCSLGNYVLTVVRRVGGGAKELAQ